jgi:hypothetical protein
LDAAAVVVMGGHLRGDMTSVASGDQVEYLLYTCRDLPWAIADPSQVSTVVADRRTGTLTV